MVHQKITQIKVKIPKELAESIDLLVEIGLYPNRNEAIRDAIRANVEEAEQNE